MSCRIEPTGSGNCRVGEIVHAMCGVGVGLGGGEGIPPRVLTQGAHTVEGRRHVTVGIRGESRQILIAGAGQGGGGRLVVTVPERRGKVPLRHRGRLWKGQRGTMTSEMVHNGHLLHLMETTSSGI